MNADNTPTNAQTTVTSALPRIVIVGGGAGGLNLATRLGKSLGRKGRAEITLIDENLSHLWKPSLHEFAAGTKAPEEEISFLVHSHNYGYNFRLGRFAGIDHANGAVQLDPVLGENDIPLSPHRTIPFDRLIIAIGSRSNDFGTPGVAERCLFLDTPGQARRLQTEILNMCLRLETGALQPGDGGLRIAIVGGGATGVELAAELREATEQLGRNGIDKLALPQAVAISVIEAADRLLGGLPPEISTKVAEKLRELDIDIHVSHKVAKVSEHRIEFADGSELEAEIVVWAAGIKGNAALDGLDGLEHGSLGRLKVLPTLQSTQDPRIYVMGDAADCLWPEMDQPLPPRAQVAAQQAGFLAGQLKRDLAGETLQEFRYVDRGSLVALSSDGAVGSLMGKSLGTLTIEGWLARRAYKYLHYQHEASVQGPVRAALRAVLSGAMRRVRPRLKLH